MVELTVVHVVAEPSLYCILYDVAPVDDQPSAAPVEVMDEEVSPVGAKQVLTLPPHRALFMADASGVDAITPLPGNVSITSPDISHTMAPRRLLLTIY